MDDDVFSAAVLEKLPLADAVWRLLQFTMADNWLEDLWARKRGRCYEQDLKFSTLAHLIADALLEHSGSGNQAFERAQEAEVLPVSITSAYAVVSRKDYSPTARPQDVEWGIRRADLDG
jgi:hypothetical protein